MRAFRCIEALGCAARRCGGQHGCSKRAPALVVPKGQTERLAYISEFGEAAKSSGLVQRAIDRAGQPGYRVAAPGNAGGAPASGR
jgi:hypothetical protein